MFFMKRKGVALVFILLIAGFFVSLNFVMGAEYPFCTNGQGNNCHCSSVSGTNNIDYLDASCTNYTSQFCKNGSTVVCVRNSNNNYYCKFNINSLGCVMHTYYRDSDGDGYGNPAVFITSDSTTPPTCYVNNNGDISDNNASIHPTTPVEICNYADDNGNGLKDEGCDVDNDHYANSSLLCQTNASFWSQQWNNNFSAIPAWYWYGDWWWVSGNGWMGKNFSCNTHGGDCNDNNSLIHPGSKEICNGVDDDFDFETDEGCDTDYDHYANSSMFCPIGTRFWSIEWNGTMSYDRIWHPNDISGWFYYGNGWRGKYFPCLNSSGDCNDGNASINLGAIEQTSDAVDNNCNGQINETSVTTTRIFYRDSDGDGYGNPLINATSSSNIPSAGYVNNNGDTDDTDIYVNPGVVELCNGVDDNCVNGIDEYCATVGNGVVDGNEECDDGNIANGDGCNSTGRIEPNGVCIINNIGGSACCVNYCTYNQQGASCSGVRRTTRTCSFAIQLNATLSCYNWSAWSAPADCTTGRFCTSGQCIELGTQPIRFCSDILNSPSNCTGASPEICNRSVNEYLFDIVSYTSIPSAVRNVGFCNTNYPTNPQPITDPTFGLCNFYARNCTCGWNSLGGNCSHRFDEVVNCTANAFRGKCVTTNINRVDSCSTTGKITYTRNASWTWTIAPSPLPLATSALMQNISATCRSTTTEYSCPETTQLPLFGIWSFSGSVLIIILVCLIRKKIEDNKR